MLCVCVCVCERKCEQIEKLVVYLNLFANALTNMVETIFTLRVIYQLNQAKTKGDRTRIHCT